jgi:hypothetical protein
MSTRRAVLCVGFAARAQLGEDVVNSLRPRLLQLLGLEDREGPLRFADGAWVRPDRRTVVVRDQTCVHYRPGEGVAPHVDGKDATVLCYLNDVPAGGGGATVFPELELSPGRTLAVAPSRGTVLVYWSDNEMLHYSAKLRAEEKWIMQLLIDFKYDPSVPLIDWETGVVIG